MTYTQIMVGIVAVCTVIIVLLLLALVVIGVTIINRFDDTKDVDAVDPNAKGDTIATITPQRSRGEIGG
jgi:hypothetical protein